MLTVKPLDAALGAEIAGVDVAAPLAEADREALRAALYEHSLVVLRDQRLEPAALERFARCFGTPKPHILDHLRLPQCPSILLLSNIVENGAPIGVYDGAAYWHTDMSFEQRPAAATVVHALEVPETGGETLFANMFRAYAALDEDTRRRIDGLTVVHHYGNRDDLDESSSTSASALNERQKQEVHNVFHPLVLAHPGTARKALYGVSGSSFGIDGMDDGEAIRLLDELKRHATGPRFVYAHRYRQGDVVVWDNFSTLHAATPIAPATGPLDRRMLYRISVVPDHDIAA